MTGLTETEDIIKGLDAGGVDYVTKPIVPDELLARIRVHPRQCAHLAERAHRARRVGPLPSRCQPRRQDPVVDAAGDAAARRLLP